jgi:hypothetical protein
VKLARMKREVAWEGIVDVESRSSPKCFDRLIERRVGGDFKRISTRCEDRSKGSGFTRCVANVARECRLLVVYCRDYHKKVEIVKTRRTFLAACASTAISKSDVALHAGNQLFVKGRLSQPPNISRNFDSLRHLLLAHEFGERNSSWSTRNDDEDDPRLQAID